MVCYLCDSLISQVWEHLHGDAVGLQLQAAAVQPVPKLWSFLSWGHSNKEAGQWSFSSSFIVFIHESYQSWADGSHRNLCTEPGPCSESDAPDAEDTTPQSSLLSLQTMPETCTLWPLTSILSCLTGSASCRSAKDSSSPVWSIHARKSWAKRCLLWLLPTAAGPDLQQSTHIKQGIVSEWSLSVRGFGIPASCCTSSSSKLFSSLDL